MEISKQIEANGKERRSRILFVDDEVNFLESVRRQLRSKEGEWDITFACSANEALHKANEIEFDVILTDVLMPEISGLDLLCTLRNSLRTKDIPIVIITALSDQDIKRRALDFGATDLFHKPFEYEDLIARINSALKLKSYQDQLKKNNMILNKQLKELERLDKMRTELFNMLIHDFKGPISVMIGNLDILFNTVDGENLEYIEAIQMGCDTLFSMATNLIDISRIEEGSLRLIFEKIDPLDLITESTSRLPGFAKSKNIKIEFKSHPSANNEPLFGDRGILLRVMQNLLMNAIYYSPVNEIIELEFSYTESNMIIFSIKDNGPGIPPDLQYKIFDKFVQVEKKFDGRVYSTGLGLSFCKLAIETHKGTICVVSDGIKGSSFKFSLPLGQDNVF